MGVRATHGRRRRRCISANPPDDAALRVMVIESNRYRTRSANRALTRRAAKSGAT